jgi:UDP-glucose 4-epimerase
MKIVVTGSSGQVGSYLLEHFAKSAEVLGIDNRESPFVEFSRFTTKKDVRDRDIGKLLKNADWVIHCAAQVSIEKSTKDPLFDAENNIMGTVNLLWNSFLHEVHNFLYISSAAVYGNPVRVPLDEEHPTKPLSPYGVSKLCGEKYTTAFAETYGLNSCIIRPFNIYSSRSDPKSPYSGVVTKFIAKATEGEPLVIEGNGSQTRDFVHISDVVDLIDLIVKKPQASTGRIFNCGTGQRSSILELAQLVQSNSKNKVEITHTVPRQGDIKDSCADMSAANNLLGFVPKVKLSDGIARLMA